MKLGYARVSRKDQNIDSQIDALEKFGVEQIFKDYVSGAKAERTGFSKMLDFARDGDCIVIWRLDRLARSMKNLIEVSHKFQERSIQLISLTENIDTTTTSGKLFFHIFGALAEFERNIMIERTRAGLAAARARGRCGGRRPSLTRSQFEHAEKLLREGTDTEAAARILRVSERTMRRVAAGEYKFSEGAAL